MTIRFDSPPVRLGERLLAAVLLLASPGPAARGGEPAAVAPQTAEPSSSIRITTDPSLVAACRTLGEAVLSGDDAFALLRQEAVRRGADVALLTSLVGQDVRGRLYRCGSPEGAGTAPAGRTGGILPAVSPAVPPAGSGSPPPPASPLRDGQVSPTPAAGPVSSPSTRPTPSPRDPSPTATDRAAASRRSAGERQRRAQEEFLDLQAAVRVTEDSKLVEGCEKRGEGNEVGEDALSALRGDAVGQLANAVLFHRTAEGTAAVFFRCPARTLQAIPPLAAPTPAR